MRNVMRKGLLVFFLIAMVFSVSTLEARERRPVVRVVEPASMALLGAGLISVAVLFKKKKNDK